MPALPEVACGQDNHQMKFENNFPVQGVPNFRFRCPRCGGTADIQFHNGEWVQVRLTGDPREFRPPSIRPGEQLQIPVAYTLGSAPARSTVPVEPWTPPAPAYTLAPGQQGTSIAANHPMHPNNIRQRMLGR